MSSYNRLVFDLAMLLKAANEAHGQPLEERDTAELVMQFLLGRTEAAPLGYVVVNDDELSQGVILDDEDKFNTLAEARKMLAYQRKKWPKNTFFIAALMVIDDE